jgi:uncharacterized protein (TIGR03437 family)
MKLARVLLPIAMAAPLIAQTWDTSGNAMLNGTYYFRHVLYLLSSSAQNGTLSDSASLYGTVNFTGTGTYSMNFNLVDIVAQTVKAYTASGTYSIAASGQGFISNPVFSGDSIYGVVNAQGIFVGSSTENQNLYNDVFIAAPLSTPQPSLSTFKGSYSFAYMDLSGLYPQYTIGAMLQMSPDGAGHIGTVGVSAYQGQYGSAKAVQSLPNVTYISSGGAAVVTFPTSTTALFSGQYYLYFSPDGNFVFGGSRYSSDLLVGVRTGTGTPNLSGLYYEAGLDQDDSTLSAGYATPDSFYGSFSANGGAIVGHQRLADFFVASAYNYTYSDSYTVAANGLYSNPIMNYVVGGGIRIGSGIGPYLGLSVALQAPSMSSTLSATPVFLNPQGIVNAGSFAPFTAGLAPGELLTLYGANLASGTQVESGIPFPTTLGNVQVTVNNIPAPLYYVTPTQLSAIVPYGVTGTIAKVQVFNNNVASNAVTTLIAKTAPGVLTQLQDGLGYGDVVHPDGTLVNAGNPAQIGETVSVYLTGLGAVSPGIADGAAGPPYPYATTPSGTITAYIGGVAATVGYSGLAPGLAGLYQINLTVPAGLTAGDNNLDIAGPDSYSSECLIAIAGTTVSASAAPAYRAVPHALSRRGSRLNGGPNGGAGPLVHDLVRAAPFGPATGQ